MHGSPSSSKRLANSSLSAAAEPELGLPASPILEPSLQAFLPAGELKARAAAAPELGLPASPILEPSLQAFLPAGELKARAAAAPEAPVVARSLGLLEGVGG